MKKFFAIALVVSVAVSTYFYIVSAQMLDKTQGGYFLAPAWFFTALAAISLIGLIVAKKATSTRARKTVVANILGCASTMGLFFFGLIALISLGLERGSPIGVVLFFSVVIASIVIWVAAVRRARKNDFSVK